MFRWLLKIDVGEHPDDMSNVRVWGERGLISLTEHQRPLLAVVQHAFQMASGQGAIGLSRIQTLYHLCVARHYQISVNSIFKHIHTTI